MSKADRDEAVLNFVEQILHGDDEHKAWLRAAAAAYVAGIWPLPKEAGGSTKTRRIASLTAALDEAEKALADCVCHCGRHEASELALAHIRRVKETS